MATYYWVGGSGTWDSSSSARWSATSGGAGGAGVPNETDFVIFNSASSGASYTVQVSINSYCARITATAPAAGNITFSNTVANDGYFMNCGTFSVAPVSTTSINIYNGAIFTPGASQIYMVIFLYVYASGTSTVTFNSSGAATQPICFSIFQGSNGAYSNTLNFCNTSTQTFNTVTVGPSVGSGYVTSPTYTNFVCTAATISIIGGINNTETFGFGASVPTPLDPYTSYLYTYAGNINLTNTSITIGAAATLATASYGGAFYLNAASTSCGTLSCGGTSISILRVPTVNNLANQTYFNISSLYACSTSLANLTLSNGAMPAYYGELGNIPGITGNLVISNTVSNAAGLYLSAYLIISQNFTIGGTTTITASSLYFYSYSSYNLTHTGAVSLVGSALGLCTYNYQTGGTITFSSTLSSTNPTSVASALHAINFLNGAMLCAGNVNLVDTSFTVYSVTTTGAANTWTHGTVNGYAGNGGFVQTTFSLTKGLTTLTKAEYYNLVGGSFSFAALTLSGSILNCYQGITTTGNVILSPYSTTTLSSIAAGYNGGTGGISITGTLSSTNAVSVNFAHVISASSGNLSVSSTVNLVDAYLYISGGTVSSTTFTHSNLVAYAISSSNVVGSTFSTTAGAISLTQVNYSFSGNVTANSGASTITLSGSNIAFLANVTASTLTLTNSATIYSTVDIYGTPTLASLTSTSGSTGGHVIRVLSYGLATSGAISLVDTQITVAGAVSCTTYTHSNVSASPIALTNTFSSSFTTTGAISITKAIYNVSSTMSSGASNTTLTGSSLSVGSTLGGATVTLANSVNVYSTLAVTGATSIASLVSTSTGTGAHATTFIGAFSTTGLVSLVDTTFRTESTTSVGTTWTQTKTTTGTAKSSNIFGGNATFGGNTAFTNSDVVFAGQTNSVTGTFSFTVTSATNVVSEGFYPTNDNPAITFLYNGASTLGVSSSFTITGATTNRTNVRTFVPYVNSEPVNFKYNQVTISVASVSLSYVNFQNVTASGATPWTGTALGDATGNTNITFPAAATRFLVASSGTVQSNTAIWATSSGGATSLNNYPLPQDTIVVDNNSASAGAVVLNFASVVYATNVVGQASINRQVTFSRSDRSSLILLGNITLFTPTAGGLVFDLLNVTLTNASPASAHILSWPTGYAPVATSNTVQLYTYSLGSMTLSGSTSSSAYLATIGNQTAAPASGSYGSFTITEGVETYANIVQIANSTVNNFTSSTIYTTSFSVPQVATTAYTLSAPTSLGVVMTLVNASYVGTLNLAAQPYQAVNVYVPSIGTLNISIYSPANVPTYLQFLSCTVGNMTGGGTNASNQIYLYGYSGPDTITKVGGGFVQLNYVRPYNLSAAPANTFYATNSSLAPSGTATGWTFTAAPTATAGGNFFLEF